MNVNYFDHDDLVTFFTAFVCPNGHVGAKFIGPGKRPHFAQIRCDEEGCFGGFLPMPRDLSGQKRRRAKRVPLPVGADYCWICNVTAEVLENLGMQLEAAHHRDRAALIEAGLDPEDDETFPVCTYHHRWIDREREQARRWLGLFQAYETVTPEPKGIG